MGLPPMTNKSSEWRTPNSIFGPINAAFQFDLDACAADSNMSKVPDFITPEEDSLKVDWAKRARDVATRNWGDGTRSSPGLMYPRIWCNPPYGRALTEWLRKAVAASYTSFVVVLIFANTDTRYWHESVMGHAEAVTFIKGRVKFERPDGSVVSAAPRASALITFSPFSKRDGSPRLLGWTQGQSADRLRG